MGNLFEKFKEKQAKFRDFQEKRWEDETRRLKKRRALEKEKRLLSQERAKKQAIYDKKFNSNLKCKKKKFDDLDFF